MSDWMGRRLWLAGVLVTIAPLSLGACGSPQGNQVATSASDATTLEWEVRRFSREGPGEPIGTLQLTDPSGGPPRAATVGSHGIRITLDEIVSSAGSDTSEGETRADEAGTVVPEVRVVYSREGAADTRAFVAVASPDRPGLYLGTVELVASGNWRFRIRVVDGISGSAQISVANR